ncbi:MAG: Xaa-Pro aminopeptidase, partial [Phycisphaerales bacterium]
QEGVPGTGEIPLNPDTCWSIELNITDAIPEWDGQDIRIMLEEDAVFDGRACEYLDGRQTQLLLIPRQPAP